MPPHLHSPLSGLPNRLSDVSYPRSGSSYEFFDRVNSASVAALRRDGDSRSLEQIKISDSLDRLEDSLFHHFMRDITIGIYIEELCYRLRVNAFISRWSYLITHTHTHTHTEALDRYANTESLLQSRGSRWNSFHG